MQHQFIKATAVRPKCTKFLSTVKGIPVRSLHFIIQFSQEQEASYVKELLPRIITALTRQVKGSRMKVNIWDYK